MTKDIATVKAALDLLHEIKAQLRTHVEFDHATRLMAAVGDMAEAARAYVETALSSPPAIDLESLKREKDAYFAGGITGPGYKTIDTFLEHLAATGKLGGDDLGELLKRVPEDCAYQLMFSPNAQYEQEASFLVVRGQIEVTTGEGTTPAEAVRKAMEKMEEGE